MNTDDQENASRGGKAAPSEDGIEAFRTPKVPLGDIGDIYGFVRKIARPLAGTEDELDDLVSEGVALACAHDEDLAAGESLSQKLSYLLESRLRDHRRKQHREWRRNSRAATAYALPAATGLAWEHGATTAGMSQYTDTPLINSRFALASFRRQEDLYNPRLIGRFAGVPSAAAIATGAAQEIWASIENENDLGKPPPFSFKKSDL
jgi:hypothetical protein